MIPWLRWIEQIGEKRTDIYTKWSYSLEYIFNTTLTELFQFSNILKYSPVDMTLQYSNLFWPLTPVTFRLYRFRLTSAQLTLCNTLNYFYSILISKTNCYMSSIIVAILVLLYCYRIRSYCTVIQKNFSKISHFSSGWERLYKLAPNHADFCVADKQLQKSYNFKLFQSKSKFKFSWIKHG